MPHIYQAHMETNFQVLELNTYGAEPDQKSYDSDFLMMCDSALC